MKSTHDEWKALPLCPTGRRQGTGSTVHVAAVVLGRLRMIRATQKNRINTCKSCGGTCSFFLSRVWDKEKYNFDSPRGIKRQTFGIRALMLYHWATETLWWATVLQGAYEKKSIHSVALLRRPRSVAHGAIFCFLGKREGSARDEACASRRARNKNKIKKEKKTVVDLPPSQIQSVSGLQPACHCIPSVQLSKTKRYTKQSDSGGGVEKRGRLRNYLHT